MALSTYAELQSSIAAFLHRDDDPDILAAIPDFIRLAEADLQIRAKLSQWDTSAAITLTAGVGALPADFAHAQSVSYGAGDYTIDFMPQIGFDAYAVEDESGEPTMYTIRGTNLLIYPKYTGNVTLKYTARFTPLSTSATSNSLLTLFPDAYLNGSLMHANVWCRDDVAAGQSGALFEQAVIRIKKYMLEYKYPDGLQMRAA